MYLTCRFRRTVTDSWVLTPFHVPPFGRQGRYNYYSVITIQYCPGIFNDFQVSDMVPEQSVLYGFYNDSTTSAAAIRTSPIHFLRLGRS